MMLDNYGAVVPSAWRQVRWLTQRPSGVGRLYLGGRRNRPDCSDRSGRTKARVQGATRSGNRELVKNHPQARVYACKEEKVLLATEELPSDRPSTFTIGRTKVAHVVTPGHTKFHSAFLVQNGLVSDHESSTLGLDLDRVEAIFSGDTLFAAGAGNHFEGPASDLYSSLHEKEIAGCPDSSLVFCGHEYTASNLAFAIWLEKHVPKGEQGVLARLEDRQQDCALRRRDKQPTIPTTLGLERATSPWMRCHQHDNPLSVRPQLHEIQQSVGDMSYLSQYPDAVQVGLWIVDCGQ
eukprot:scaffold569_cov408-Prasinococcus_capsulatus_cf.AAC.9